MPKYLFQASYTVQGEEGVRAKGGSDRRDAVADTMRSVGGDNVRYLMARNCQIACINAHEPRQ